MSAILLDTHAFIWLSENDSNLPTSLKAKIETTDDVFVSIASFWEISIKVSLGKLELESSFDSIESRFNVTRFKLLPIEIKDTVVLQTLPFHHKDPFDRIIIAQAVSREIDIASRDSAFEAYPVRCIWEIECDEHEDNSPE